MPLPPGNDPVGVCAPAMNAVAPNLHQAFLELKTYQHGLPGAFVSGKPQALADTQALRLFQHGVA